MKQETQDFDPAIATVRGTFWTYLSNVSGKLLIFISTVVLARLLTKEDFGIAGYALIFIAFLDVLSDLGIGLALIYFQNKPERTNTAFWLNIGIGWMLFGLTWFTAPLAGAFFDDPRAIPVIQVLGLTFPLMALSNVHDALLRKRLSFKRKLIPDLFRAVSKGVISIILAVMGFGPWSLILGQLGGTALSVLGFWLAEPWKPSFRFDRQFVRPLLSYGMGIVAINGLGVLVLNVDYLFVARYLGAVALGVYTLAFRVPDLLIKQFCTIIAKVVFPVYTRMRDNDQELGQGFLITMKYTSLVTVPMGLGLAAVAEPFVMSVFSEKWADAIPVIPAIAIYTVLRSLTFNVGDVYKAQGRLKLLTQISLIQLGILVPVLWIVIEIFPSITAIAWAQAAVALAGGGIKLVVAGQILRTPLRRLLETLEPAFLAGIVMLVVVLATQQILNDTSHVFQLTAGVLFGLASYVLSLWWLQQEVLVEAGVTLRAALMRR